MKKLSVKERDEVVTKGHLEEFFNSKNLASKDDFINFATKDYVDQAVVTILNAIQSESDISRKEANDRYCGMIEHKDDNMRIYNDRYNEVKSDIVMVKSEVINLKSRVSKLENN